MIWLPVVGSWADVDVYASILGYTALLNRTGKSAKAYIPDAPNYSTPEALRIKEIEGHDYDLSPDDQIIILDTSTPDVIERLAPTNQIVELIDHHPGYEKYWQEKIGDKAIIEKIGAVATIVYERWVELGKANEMSPEIAKLLLAAILDNTLNFNAVITTDRDRVAAEKLAQVAETTVEEFARWYFSAVSQAVTYDLRESLLGDVKKLHIPKINLDILCGQLALWDVDSILGRREEISDIMDSGSEEWLVNILSISEKQNYILTNDARLAGHLTDLLSLHANADWLISDRLYLRKEIIAAMLED